MKATSLALLILLAPVPAAWAGSDIKTDIRDDFGLFLRESKSGLWVTAVLKESPADFAGIRPGYRITSVNGEPVTSRSDLAQMHTHRSNLFECLNARGAPVSLTVEKQRRNYVHPKGHLLPMLKRKDLLLTELDVGDPAPDFLAHTDEGEVVALSSLRGKVVLVHFTSTRCYSCRMGLPQIHRAHQRFSPDDLAIITVFNDYSLEAVQAYREKFNMRWPYYFDGEKIRNQPRMEYGADIASYTVVGRDGRILHEDVNYNGVYDSLREAISRLRRAE
ncbi:MAG: redoxin domain-containing protein [Verrucomicrobiota bacterium]